MLNYRLYNLTLLSQIIYFLGVRVQNVKGLSVLFNDNYKTGKEIVNFQSSMVSVYLIL